jgi:hypothetical protein
MTRTIFLLLLFVSNAYAFGLEDLNKPFIGKDERGPLKTDYLRTIEDALNDIGQGDFMLDLKEKLGLYDLDKISTYVQACKTEDDTLGYYRRGTISTTKSTIQYGDDIFAKDWGPETADKIEKAYKHNIVNNNSHVSLVLTGWPIICIRPGQKLGSIIATFAHEVTHYVGDDELPIDYSVFESEKDFVQKYLEKSGGEYHAFQATGKVLNELNTMYEFRIRMGLMSYFEDGEVVNSEGLKKYILDSLGYRKRFINNYRKSLVEDYNSEVNSYNSMINFLENYQQNLQISKSNMGVHQHNLQIHESNIGVYESNIKLFEGSIARGGRYTQADLDREKAKLEKAKAKIEEAKAAYQRESESVKFYENMVTFAQASLDSYKERMEILKQRHEQVKKEIEARSGVIRITPGESSGPGPGTIVIR